MHKLPNGKYMASRKNANDDWCERQSAKRSRLLCLLVRLLIPPKRGVNLKAPCQKSSRSLRKDSTSRPGLGFTLSMRIIAICLLSSVVKVACEVYLIYAWCYLMI